AERVERCLGHNLERPGGTLGASVERRGDPDSDGVPAQVSGVAARVGLAGTGNAYVARALYRQIHHLHIVPLARPDPPPHPLGPHATAVCAGGGGGGARSPPSRPVFELRGRRPFMAPLGAPRRPSLVWGGVLGPHPPRHTDRGRAGATSARRRTAPAPERDS